MKRLAAILALVAAPAVACDLTPDSAAVMIYTDHPNATIQFAEPTQGVFLGWQCNRITTRAGIFENSFGSLAGTINWTHDALSLQIGGLDARPFAGVMYYTENYKPVRPIGGLEVTYGNAFAQVIPLFGHGADAIITAGLRWEF